MPKLLQINSVLNTGSTGRIVEYIGQYVLTKKWESYVAAGRSLGRSKSTVIKIGNMLEQKRHGLKTRLFDKHGLGSRLATVRLLEQIDNISPDLIHLHNLHGYYLNYPLLFDYLYRQSIPVVWSLHDCWAFTGHCSHFSDINCLKWKTHCEKCTKSRNYPSSIFLDNSYKNFEKKKEVFSKLSNLTLVTVSDWLASKVKESILQTYPVKTIHNGVSLDEFFPMGKSTLLDTKYSFSNRKVLLAVATSWAKNKGWEDYLTLAGLLPANYVMVLVGVTQKQKRLLPSGIIGIKRTENIKELAVLYSHADVLLNLSYQETFGLTTVEGFACGTPSIVYNATASPELVTEDTGVIVEPGNLKGVLAAIEFITSKGKDFFEKSCRELALKRYNKEDRYSEYFELYNSLLTGSA